MLILLHKMIGIIMALAIIIINKCNGSFATNSKNVEAKSRHCKRIPKLSIKSLIDPLLDLFYY